MSEVKTRQRREKKDVPVPSGVAILLSREQIWTAIGVSDRTFTAMVASGGYPRPDFYLGPLPRWTAETHNAWVKAQCKGAGD